MKFLFKALLLAFLITLSQAYADDISDNKSYALMQECLAGAELDANAGTQLDRYCINSYLAAQPPSQEKNDAD